MIITSISNEYLGYNSRLDEIQAAFLRVKLKHLDDIVTHKHKLAEVYLRGISNNFITPSINPEYYDGYHIFNIRHKERDRLKIFLFDHGIRTEIHYPLAPHKQNALKFMNSLKFPVSEEIHNTTLSLPISTCHSVDDVMQVVQIINNFKC